MSSEHTPWDLAVRAADTVRCLNRRALQPDAFPFPTDVHHTLGALAGMLEQLPDTLHRLAAGLHALPADHLAVHADPPTPEEYKARVALELGEAIADIERAAARLRRAQHTAAELVWTGPIPGL